MSMRGNCALNVITGALDGWRSTRTKATYTYGKQGHIRVRTRGKNVIVFRVTGLSQALEGNP